MSKVVIVDNKECKYPKDFYPSNKYPEYKFSEINKQDNKIYDSIRTLLYLYGGDQNNFNKPNWNPLKDIIKPNDIVFIKPNLVNHLNENKNDSLDSVITHPSIIKALIDYVIIALQNKGKIIVGDAPIQKCDFNSLVNDIKLTEIIKYYQNKGFDIELVDLRDSESICFDLENDSYQNNRNNKKLRVTNYNPKDMVKYHNETSHQYFISKSVMNADVIINLVKPKCHRKAGMTGAIKNFIGVNCRKENLPHHAQRSLLNHGDEYQRLSIIKLLKSFIYDQKNIAKFENNNKKYKIFNNLYNKITKIKQKNNQYNEGSWYGNDTIWRTILDVYSIVSTKRILNIGDLIISGEKDGPLAPTSKQVGYLLMSDNAYSFDMVLAKIMGFNYHKIKYLHNFKQKNKEIEIISNQKELNGNLNYLELNKHFVPAFGWENHLERKSKILFVIGSANIGGAEVGMIEIVNELKDKYDISICFCERKGPLLERIPKNVKTYTVFSGKENRIVKKIKRYLYYHGSSLLYKSIIKEKFDTEIAFIEGGPAMFISKSRSKFSNKIASIRVDLSKHELDVEKRIKNKNKSYKYLVNVYKKFNKIYGVSEATTNSFINKFPMFENKCLTINTYFDQNDYLQKSLLINNIYEQSVFNIISVGRFFEQKGYDRIVDIAKMLKNDNIIFKWYIIGRYNNVYGERIIKLIKEAGLDEVIILLGEVNNPYPYIYNSNLLVSTSNYEGYPRVINEAVTLMVPVVAPDISGVKEIIDNKYGLMAKNNTKDIYTNIKKIIENKKIYDDIKDNLKKRIINKKDFYDKFIELIEGE